MMGTAFPYRSQVESEGGVAAPLLSDESDHQPAGFLLASPCRFVHQSDGEEEHRRLRGTGALFSPTLVVADHNCAQ